MKKYLLEIVLYIGLSGILAGAILFFLPWQPKITAGIVLTAGIAFVLAGALPKIYVNHPWRWLIFVHRLDLFCVVAGVVSYIFVSLIMIIGLHLYTPTSGVQVAIVPGCKADNGSPSLMLQERLNKTYSYLIANPNAVCIVCGGKGADETEPEAASMQKYLVHKGIDPSRILEDTTSTNTLGNIQNAVHIMAAHNLGSKAVIVTNSFHQYRSQLYADSCGLHSVALICPTSPGLLFTSWIREVPGVILAWF